jgi:hypothetical protein
MKALTYQAEPFAAWHRQAIPHMQAHWREIALHQDRFPLNPDWDRGIALERSGQLAAYTARDAGNYLQGYAVFIVGPHVHYRDCMLANADLFYLNPDYRQGTAAVRFLRFCDAHLAKHWKVHRVIHRVKSAHDWSPILAHMGYAETERIFERLVN